MRPKFNVECSFIRLFSFIGYLLSDSDGNHMILISLKSNISGDVLIQSKEKVISYHVTNHAKSSKLAPNLHDRIKLPLLFV